MRNANDGSNLTSRRLPEELVINNKRINDASEIASKLNAYFTSIANGLAENRSNGSTLKIVSEYDQEIPQSQTADNPVAP